MISSVYFKKLNLFIYKSFHSSGFYLNNQHLPSIYSLSSGWNGRSAIAVVRISGSNCLKVIEGLTLKKFMDANQRYRNVLLFCA